MAGLGVSLLFRAVLIPAERMFLHVRFVLGRLLHCVSMFLMYQEIVVLVHGDTFF